MSRSSTPSAPRCSFTRGAVHEDAPRSCVPVIFQALGSTPTGRRSRSSTAPARATSPLRRDLQRLRDPVRRRPRRDAPRGRPPSRADRKRRDPAHAGRAPSALPDFEGVTGLSSAQQACSRLEAFRRRREVPARCPGGRTRRRAAHRARGRPARLTTMARVRWRVVHRLGRDDRDRARRRVRARGRGREAVPHPDVVDGADPPLRQARSLVPRRPQRPRDREPARLPLRVAAARPDRRLPRSALAGARCGEAGTFVKRLIGLPGDDVSERNGHWSVNGKPLARAVRRPREPRRRRHAGTCRPASTSSWATTGSTRATRACGARCRARA